MNAVHIIYNFLKANISNLILTVAFRLIFVSIDGEK